MLKRPPFATVVDELKKVGASKYTEGLSTTRSTEFWEEAEKQMKQSPDMRPTRLPEGMLLIERVKESSNALPSLVESDGSSGSTSPLSHPKANKQDRKDQRHLNVDMIPMQRVITPISEEDKAESTSASPVDYKPIIRIPPEAVDSSNRTDGMPSKDATLLSDKPSDTTTSSRTTTTSSKADSSTTDGSKDPFALGFEIARFGSPEPADETIAQRKNESRYRLNLQHDFHTSCMPLAR